MSIYVFDDQAASLQGFADKASALAGCDPAGLKAQRWLFFDQAGQPLRAECHADGRRLLRPWASCSSCTLEQLLPYVRVIGGEASLSGLRQLFPDSSWVLDAGRISSCEQ